MNQLVVTSPAPASEKGSASQSSSMCQAKYQSLTPLGVYGPISPKMCELVVPPPVDLPAAEQLRVTATQRLEAPLGCEMSKALGAPDAARASPGAPEVSISQLLKSRHISCL
ncbi:uncharacterized protein LOC126934428 [Macaca thibetana thibetana]|uniref:uncharacterized protein LOC106998987 n=1 Tax=Macaca mulatta TaxID=9544 RepID=UPI0010A29AEA|nr:uncharacterized protein LOC106998987 [Macaca mulatta]XP_050611221.1 uncharacterized protein LOC126934428 [Macaca thibetana thibetana]